MQNKLLGRIWRCICKFSILQKNTKIVEIKPTNRPNLVSKTISETQNLNFNLIETDVLPKNKKRDGIILNKNLLDKYL